MINIKNIRENMKEKTKPRTARLTDSDFNKFTKNGKISFVKSIRDLSHENEVLRLKLELTSKK